VPGLFHDFTGHRDGGDDSSHGADGSGGEISPVHDGGIQFEFAIRIRKRSETDSEEFGIELAGGKAEFNDGFEVGAGFLGLPGGIDRDFTGFTPGGENSRHIL